MSVKIDFEQIRELLAVFSQTDVTEITIESGEEKITLKKAPPPSAVPPGEASEYSISHVSREQTRDIVLEPQVEFAPEPEVKSKPVDNGLVPIASPMVGTFYASPSPTAPAFVKVGDQVTIGQTVCIIEAMKLMNDLPSEVSGRVVKICVDNGTTVEYGQALFLVDPKG
jgi:acetyl-CoA carboxylase biotin carboxyl carrier protein